MVIKMTFKEYVQKDKKDMHNMHTEQVFKSEEASKHTRSQIKSQNASGEAVLDGDALNAVAGGVGDVNVDVDIETKVTKKDINSNTVLEQIDDHSDHSVIEKFVETKGDIVARGGISF